MSAFSDMLVSLRQNRGMSQKDLATESSYDKSFISRLESASRQPHRHSIILISEALGLTGDETDQLLLSAGFAPVQSGALLNLPTLALLDDWFGVHGNDQIRHDIEVFVGTLVTGQPVDHGTMRAVAI